MDNLYRHYIAIACIYITSTTPLAAANDASVQQALIHPHEDIASTAKDFITSETQQEDDSARIHIKSLDKRLQLHQCTQPLQAFWPPGASKLGNTSVGIRCTDHKPWKIYIAAQIKLFEQVWVTNTAIARGTILSQANASLETREISVTHREYFNQQQSPLGLIAKRSLRKGDIIPVPALEKPMAIKRGDRVVVIARINGLEIRTTATALSSAAEGDRVRVRNVSSKKEMEGTLSKNSVVFINI